MSFHLNASSHFQITWMEATSQTSLYYFLTMQREHCMSWVLLHLDEKVLNTCKIRARAAWNLSGGRSTNRGKTGNTCTNHTLVLWSPKTDELKDACPTNKTTLHCLDSGAGIRSATSSFDNEESTGIRKPASCQAPSTDKGPQLTETSSNTLSLASGIITKLHQTGALHLPTANTTFLGKHDGWSEQIHPVVL